MTAQHDPNVGTTMPKEGAPTTYMDHGIKIEVPAIPNLESLRKATEFLCQLYLSHSADSGGT